MKRSGNGLWTLAAVVPLVLVLAACAGKTEPETAVMSGWGGSPEVNAWITGELVPYVKETTGINLVWSPMNIDEILGKLENETSAGVTGNIDIVWINGENFLYAKNKNLLYGDILGKLDNAQKYLDPENSANTSDFGFPTGGYESPWGRAQFVFIADTEKVPVVPKSAAALLSFLRENPGVFTYPESADFTGSAFLRALSYDIIGYEAIQNLPADYQTVAAAMRPVIEYLNGIKPLLWQQGRTYPKTLAQLDALYQDELVWFTMDYNSTKSYSQIQNGLWKAGSKTFVWDAGTPANTHFLAIPANSRSKEAALKVIDGTLSPRMQASKADLALWGDSPVLDFGRLSAGERALFENKNSALNAAALSSLADAAELASHSRSEPAGDVVVLIEEVWRNEVLREK
jgi:putative spermidine/putrescine transport system substrate-binding protein